MNSASDIVLWLQNFFYDFMTYVVSECAGWLFFPLAFYHATGPGWACLEFCVEAMQGVMVETIALWTSDICTDSISSHGHFKSLWYYLER